MADNPDECKFFRPEHGSQERCLRNSTQDLRPSQVAQLHRVVSQQSPDTRLDIWSALQTQPSTTSVDYVHDLLRVSAYLLKTFPDETCSGYQTLTQLHASFIAPWDRGALDALLVSMHDLPTLAALFHSVDLSRQSVILDVAAEYPTPFETLLGWCSVSPASPTLLHSTLAIVANTDHFPLWMTLIVNVPLLHLEPFLNLLGSFSSAGQLEDLASVFLTQSDPNALIEPLVELASQDVASIQSLLPHLFASSIALVIVSLHPLLASLEALAKHLSPNEDVLEDIIATFSYLEVSLTDANHVLQFASTLPDPWPFIAFVLVLAKTHTEHLPRCFNVFGHCNTNDQLELVRLFLLDDINVTFGIALVQFPFAQLSALLTITSTLPPSELQSLVPYLETLHPDSLDPLLPLLTLPDLVRPHIYTILDGVDSPFRLLQSLQHLWLDAPTIVDPTLRLLVRFDSDQKTALATTVLHTSDRSLNCRVLGFLAAPPGEMDAREVLRLLRHVPSSSYATLVELFQSPLRSKLELLVLSELLEAVTSPVTIQSLLQALIHLDEPTLHAFFNYLEHVPDSLILVELMQAFTSADVQLYLDLALGLSQSMLRELNGFIEGLDTSGRAAFLRVIPNPRRNIMSRLIMSVHTFDNITIGNILRALEHHSWDIRSLLVEQFRILDDPMALAQVAAVHESLGADLNTRDSLETYAMIASYCSKSVQIQLAAVLYRLATSDRIDLLTMLRNHAVWLPTEAIDAGLCTLLLGHNSTVATHLLQLLGKLNATFHEPFLTTCQNLSGDMAYFVEIFHGAAVSNVRGFSPLLFGGDLLTTVDIHRLAKCVRKMLHASFGLDLAVQLLVQFPDISSFLRYFDRVGTSQSLLVHVMAIFPTATVAVVRFLQSLDMDDAALVMRRLLELPRDSKVRFEALLHQPMTRLTGREKALYLSVVDGHKLVDKSITTTMMKSVSVGAFLPSLNLLWSCDDVESKSLSRKLKRVGQTPFRTDCRNQTTPPVYVEKEFYTLSMEPNRDFSLSLASPLRDAAPSTTPLSPLSGPLTDNQLNKPDIMTPTEVPPPPPDPIQCIDSDEYESDDDDDQSAPSKPLFDHVLAENLLEKHPLHTLIEEDLDVDGLPRLHIPGRRKRPTARSMRGLMPAIQNIAPQIGKRRPSTSPGSPFEAIAHDANLMRWPPTRIQVARTPEAKRKVFDARVHKSMGTLVLPVLKGQHDLSTIRRTKSCTGL
ncbi:hypothetical protein DYB30_006582 [Aphanomyces astaci]|uniref:Uncharacterized protein n=1 Tax=Aphanomyces astaci TaxID=112090 RepID=A0A397CYQ0_APHAT|nr:hypothetical protein DYB30_006582 [Aphanomyces astaci]